MRPVQRKQKAPGLNVHTDAIEKAKQPLGVWGLSGAVRRMKGKVEVSKRSVKDISKVSRICLEGVFKLFESF